MVVASPRARRRGEDGEGMMNEQRLYAKYHITKTSDGSDVEGAFVLRPDRDRHARVALAAYAVSIQDDNPEFSQELKRWIAIEAYRALLPTAKAYNLLPISQFDREQLGRLVREAWVAYCREIGDDKPSHIAPWEELSEVDKEADRRIGIAIAEYVQNGVSS